jgi:hypothetical protein
MVDFPNPIDNSSQLSKFIGFGHMDKSFRNASVKSLFGIRCHSAMPSYCCGSRRLEDARLVTWITEYSGIQVCFLVLNPPFDISLTLGIQPLNRNQHQRKTVWTKSKSRAFRGEWVFLEKVLLIKFLEWIEI